jgi:hypothetical protein
MTNTTLTTVNVDEVMTSFDFCRVLMVMHALNWTWAGQEVTVAMLKSTADSMLHDVINDFNKFAPTDNRIVSGYTISTGGFTARIEIFKNGRHSLSLSFCVEEQDSFNK